MSEIAELCELLEAYRRKSRSVGWQPLVAAYADAADQIEETIAEMKAASPPARHPAPASKSPPKSAFFQG
jgi:hypothetical protein